MVTDLLSNAAINISHFLCSKSEEKCIACKTAAIKLHIRIYCNINLSSFLCVILLFPSILPILLLNLCFMCNLKTREYNLNQVFDRARR